MDDRPADKWTKLLSDIIVSPPRVPSSLLLVCKLKSACSRSPQQMSVGELQAFGLLEIYKRILQLDVFLLIRTMISS